jgi:alpha-N-arabinofuranosidase
MYADHFVGAIPVALSGNSPQPAPRFPPGGDQPKTSSGSPTYPLDMVAALSADKKFLILSVVNATGSEQKLDLNVSGTRFAGPSTLWQLTGSTVDAADRVGQPTQVEIKEIPLGNAPETISVAPISVNIYRFPVAQTAR